MRNSSVEVFRIIATFLVLMVHFNGWFVGMPSKLTGYSVFTITQDIIESISCICVNCFLVITGWYGLTFKWKHVWTIYSVLVWIYVPCFLLNCYLTHTFSFAGCVMSFFAIGRESYYVQCYLMLLFLSPILNSFIRKYGKSILPYTLAFWSIEIIFDWALGNNCLAFGRGYELTHFIMMYLLGQTAFIYRGDLEFILSNTRCILISILGPAIIALMYLFLPSTYCFCYSNPINIIVSFSLFLLFERRTFHNGFINNVSKSTLAVYVLHITPPIFSYLCDWDNYCLTNYSYDIYLLLMLITICITFITAVCYDKIKDLFMPKLGKYICNWLENKTEFVKAING